MKKYLYATGNKGKLEEAREIVSAIDIEIVSPFDLFDGEVPEVEETEPDYEGNARLKAEAFYAWASLPAIADDAGLEVVALHGAPGVRTARYAGEHATMQENRTKLLKALENKEDRKARFVCGLYVQNETATHYAQGVVNGTIALEERGEGGFGYDSLFVPDGYEETLAELKGRGVYIKTHRAEAFQLLADYL